MNRDASISFEKDEIGNCAKLYLNFIIAYSIAIATFRTFGKAWKNTLNVLHGRP